MDRITPLRPRALVTTPPRNRRRLSGLNAHGRTVPEQIGIHPKAAAQLENEIILPIARALGTGSMTIADAIQTIARRCYDINEYTYCIFNLRVVSLTFIEKH